MKIGFLGPKGTFSHEALEIYAQGKDGCEPIDFNSIPDIIKALRRREIDEAIVPIENSLEGAVNATMDLMAEDDGLKIKAEVVIVVNQNLLVKKGTKREDIKSILSHPQAVGQCRAYLNNNFPEAAVNYVYSTAGAAGEVAGGKGESAAIGSSVAAKVYGLEILGSCIQDGDNNLTRFVVISDEDSRSTGSDKTSIVFSTEDKPGSLYRVLDIFSLWDINMTRIESRPAKRKLGRYIFFVDIMGHSEDADIRDALTMVRRKTSFYKFLGSYPVYRVGN